MVATDGLRVTYYPPQGDYKTFDDEASYSEKGKEWGLFGKTAKKQFWYKNKAIECLVTIKGYEEYKNLQILVIEFEDGPLTCIHPSYLKEMQSSSFVKELLSGAVDGTEEISSTEIEAPAVEIGERNVKAAADENVGAAETVDVVDSSAGIEASGPEAETPKKSKAKKEKPKKLELPIEKVKFSATVKEFATKPNPFSDNDDEVLLFGEVVIVTEPTLVVGDAWCGYSNTLKGLGLEVGDQLDFEGKIVDKKFNKEILYKVNNPSKIQKRVE